MNAPTININGNTFKIKKPTAGFWRKWVEFNNQSKSIADADFIDSHCAIIADLFDGISADDLLDNLPLDEVLKIYNDCTGCLVAMLAGKFDELEKNSQAGETPSN